MLYLTFNPLHQLDVEEDRAQNKQYLLRVRMRSSGDNLISTKQSSLNLLAWSISSTDDVFEDSLYMTRATGRRSSAQTDTTHPKLRFRETGRCYAAALSRKIVGAAVVTIGSLAFSTARSASVDCERDCVAAMSAELVQIKDADLDPQTRSILDLVAKHRVDVTKLPIAEMRMGHEAFFGPIGLPLDKTAPIQEMSVPGPGGNLRLHIHKPRVADSPLPVLVYFHGGGMNAGTLEQYDSLVQRIALRANVIVVSVDYRLAPEYKFPSAHDDAYAALSWVSKNAASIGGDPKRLAVGGDSAGGNLAAAVAQMSRDKKVPSLAFQLLIYPAVGTRGNSKSASMFAEGYLFGQAELRWAYEQYLSDPKQITDSRVSPILAKNFNNLPPAFVISSEYEVMRDDIEEYAALMRAAGVPVELKRYAQTVHPFLSMAGVIDAGRIAIDDCADRLKFAFARVSNLAESEK